MWQTAHMKTDRYEIVFKKLLRVAPLPYPRLFLLLTFIMWTCFWFKKLNPRRLNAPPLRIKALRTQIMVAIQAADLLWTVAALIVIWLKSIRHVYNQWRSNSSVKIHNYVRITTAYKFRRISYLMSRFEHIRLSRICGLPNSFWIGNFKSNQNLLGLDHLYLSYSA